MKKHLLLFLIPVLIAGIAILSSFGGDENSDYPGGSPAGYTGSPGDGTDCQHCHGGTSTFIEGWITSDIPPTGYAPGNLYNITVTVTGSGDKGFQVSPQDPSGTQLGTLIAGSGTHLNGGTKYVNQNSKKTSNPAIWTFQWMAPGAGTGEVTFYGAFTVNKPVTKTSTLEVQEGTVIPLVVEASAFPLEICTGDSSHLDVEASGGTGSFTYVWTSDPPGFTSSLKDPWVYPIEHTTYSVEVTSGDIHESDSVTVTVYCLGTDDIQAGQLTLSLYPNPAVRTLTVGFEAIEQSGIELSVVSLTGNRYLLKNIRLQPGSSSHQLDLDNLVPGTYLLHVRDGEKIYTRKFVKE
ncbi:MAG: T9SS type A sorting domain-containing protein [Bacteroidales bacterium]|nr:T9SS type A sorting domain-containing protein [Bacteroidales bacterium]